MDSIARILRDTLLYDKNYMCKWNNLQMVPKHKNFEQNSLQDMMYFSHFKTSCDIKEDIDTSQNKFHSN